MPYGWHHISQTDVFQRVSLLWEPLALGCPWPLVHPPVLAKFQDGQGPANGWSYGYGSIPINTIFSGMNIHLPAILMFTRGTRFWHTAIFTKTIHLWEFFFLTHLAIYGPYEKYQGESCQAAEVPLCHLPQGKIAGVAVMGYFAGVRFANTATIQPLCQPLNVVILPFKEKSKNTTCSDFWRRQFRFAQWFPRGNQFWGMKIPGVCQGHWRSFSPSLSFHWTSQRCRVGE